MKRILHFIALLLVIHGTGCEQVIEIDLPEHTPQLVVNSFFSPDSTFKARVTHSRDRLQPYGLYEVTNATVLIKENGVTIDTLLHDKADIYMPVVGVFPQVGRYYTLEASAPGYETVSGTDYVPSAVLPYDIAWRDSAGYYEGGVPYGEISFKIDDPGGVDNYYVVHMFYYDSMYYDALMPVYFSTFDPLYESDFYGNFGLDDATFDGSTRVIKLNITADYRDYLLGRCFVGFTSCSEAYVKLRKSMVEYQNAAYNPFAEPVRIYSNMTPDMGIFAGYAGRVFPMP